MQEGSTLSGKLRLTRRWQAYAIATLLPFAAMGLRISLEPWVEKRQLLIVFLVPIILSAYYGGLWPGLFATLLVGLITDYFVLPPAGSFQFATPLDLAQGLFLLLD